MTQRAQAMTMLHQGTTFLLCGLQGDILGKGEGLFYEDTRFLSRWALRLDGCAAVPLRERTVDPHEAVFFLTNPELETVRKQKLSIVRRTKLDHGLDETIEVQSYDDTPCSFELAFE